MRCAHWNSAAGRAVPNSQLPRVSSGLFPYPQRMRRPRPPFVRSAEPGMWSAELGSHPQKPERWKAGGGRGPSNPIPAHPDSASAKQPPPGSPLGSNPGAGCDGSGFPPLSWWHPPPTYPPLPPSARRSSTSGPGAAPTPSPGPSSSARQQRLHSPGSRSRGLERSRRW